MKRFSTERYLALGMALTADKATMERRVRNIFARKSSANAAKILSLALCIALGIGCFTTACRPARDTISTETEQQATKREDVGFLSGLSESSEPVPSYPERIERAAVSINGNQTLEFDADVIAPETDGYGVARLERHVFTDAEYQAFLDYLEPGADWRTGTLDGEPFSFDAAEHLYNAVANGEGGCTSAFMAARGARTLYYSKYDSVVPQSGFNYDLYVSTEAADFDGEWQMDVASAQSVAEQMISDLGIKNVVLVGSEKAVAYDNKAEGMAELSPQTRGWMFYFAHAFNGLDFGNMNCVLSTGYADYDPSDYGVLTAIDSAEDPPDYQTPMWERLSVYVDETGVAQVDWQDALDVTETVLHNVAILSPEQAADCLTEKLRKIYGNDDNAAQATFRVIAVRLKATAIGEYPLPEAVMSANQGLLVPCWEFETVITEKAYQHNRVYRVNAVDGGTLVGKEYKGWPV